MSDRGSPGTLRALLLLLGLSARAWINRIAAGIAAKRAARASGGSATPARKPTPGKRRMYVIIAALLLPVFFWQGLFVSAIFITRVADRLDPVPHLDRGFLKNVQEKSHALTAMGAAAETSADPEAIKRYRQYRANVDEWETSSLRRDQSVRQLPQDQRERRIAELASLLDRPGAVRPVERSIFLPSPDLWPASGDQQALVRALAFFYAMLCVLLLFISLGSGVQDLGQVEGHTLWMASMPTPTATLFLAKILEYTIVNPFLWLIVLPLDLVLLYCAGWSGWTCPVALVATVAFGVMLASLRIGLETVLRMRLPPGALKNLQAMFSLASLVMMLLVYGTVMAPQVCEWFYAAANRLPMTWNPFSLTAHLGESGSGLLFVALIVASAALCAAVSVSGCSWAVRSGFLIQANAFVGKRGIAARVKASRALTILGKDLLLLRRDRNFLVQTLALPAFMVGLQLVVNEDLAKGIVHDFRHGATLAYGVAAYLLVNTAMGVLNLEGGALWLLYTAPQPIERLLIRKTMLWAVIGVCYAVVTLIILVACGATLSNTAVQDTVLVLVGVVVYAFIGAGIGIIASNPLEQNAKRRINVSAVYLFMLLSAMYAHVIYQPSGFAKLAQLTLSGLLAFALWQKVRDRIPYLLDPTAAPPPTISVSDGLIAALAFFVLQGIVFLLLLQSRMAIGPAITIAYSAAGVLVAGFCLYLFWRLKVPDLAHTLGLRAAAGARAPYWRALGVGSVGGVICAAVACGYLQVVQRVPAFESLRPTTGDLAASGDARWWFIGLAVVAAPLCEEFIFRGLLFSGLRRTVPIGWAVFGSAAIFALVHPPASVIPVFCLGVATALAYHATGLLAASIVVHAVYNAIVVLLS